MIQVEILVDRGAPEFIAELPIVIAAIVGKSVQVLQVAVDSASGIGFVRAQPRKRRVSGKNPQVGITNADNGEAEVKVSKVGVCGIQAQAGGISMDILRRKCFCKAVPSAAKFSQ